MTEQQSGFAATIRPVRLSETTRQLARRALSGEIGRSMELLDVTLDTISGIESMTDMQKYVQAIRLISAQAPLRLLPGEMLAGAATLKIAAQHAVPVLFGGKPIFSSVSHLTCGFDRVLREGYRGVRSEILDRLCGPGLNEDGKELLEAMLACLDAADVWHGRYLSLVQGRAAETQGAEKVGYEAIYKSMEHVPGRRPETFREAVQSLWLMFAFLRLCGNWPGIGRIDEMLGPYLQKDLASGAINLDEARELIAQFWIKGCEWITLEPTMSGDAQHYQNIVLGGIGEDGAEITNEVTYLVLDVIEELGIGDFPVAVRVNENTPERLLRRIAEVQRLGGGIVAVYNEKLVLKGMLEMGYDLNEARQFANDGCWEVQVPGKTNFLYIPFDLLAVLQNRTLHVGDTETPPGFASFEHLYAAFLADFRAKMRELWPEFNDCDWRVPSPLIALFTDGCIEKARDYYKLGPRYTVVSPHCGGLPDTANSLLAIRRMVYEEKLITLSELVGCLRANWEGYEELRLHAANTIEYFGNDNAEADGMARRVFEDFTALCREIPEQDGIRHPAGMSTFGRQIDWRWSRGATAVGHFRGDILSGNVSPAPGTDKKGATAIIRSHCSLGLEKMAGGSTALDIKLLPDAARGEKGIDTLVALIRGFLALDGYFMQTDIMDNADLLEAKKHPERHQNLSVRVSGWSARFITLNEEWQDMIIARTAQGK